jgi:hypothetical protein
MVCSKPARSCVSSSIRLVDSSSFTEVFWFMSCVFPGVRDTRLKHTDTSSLDKFYQSKRVDRLDHLAQAAHIVPWEVHLLECISILFPRGWQPGCFARSTRTLQG